MFLVFQQTSERRFRYGSV